MPSVMEHVTAPEPRACELEGVGVSMGLDIEERADPAPNRPGRARRSPLKSKEIGV